MMDEAEIEEHLGKYDSNKNNALHMIVVEITLVPLCARRATFKAGSYNWKVGLVFLI